MSPSGRWSAGARRRSTDRSCPNSRKWRRSTSPSMSARCPGAVLADWRPEDKDVLGDSRARHRAAQSLDLDPGAAVVVRDLAGLVGGGRKAADGRLQVHHRPVVLAGGDARHFRRGVAHLLLVHGADLRRAAVDHACNLVADDPRRRHRLCRAEPRRRPISCSWSLALLCGFGGGNFASSMANISFFFPQAEKGNALALNAGLGNLGVSVGAVRGPDRDHRRRVRLVRRRSGDGCGRERAAPLWLQNAGFIWVPFIAVPARLPHGSA